MKSQLLLSSLAILGVLLPTAAVPATTSAWEDVDREMTSLRDLVEECVRNPSRRIYRAAEKCCPRLRAAEILAEDRDYAGWTRAAVPVLNLLERIRRAATRTSDSDLALRLQARSDALQAAALARFRAYLAEVRATPGYSTEAMLAKCVDLGGKFLARAEALARAGKPAKRVLLTLRKGRIKAERLRRKAGQ